MFLRKKYTKCGEGVANDVKNLGIESCILKIELKATSKIKDYFIYEVCYLDKNETKTVPIISTGVLGVIDSIAPLINKGLTEQEVSFKLGTEEVVASRLKSKISNYERLDK